METEYGVRFRHDRLHVKPLPDPWPGVRESVDAARLRGSQLMKIVIYCEPVMYELTMPIPNASELRQIQYNPRFVDALNKVTNEDLVGDRTSMPIMIPLAARPIDKTLQNMVLHSRMDAWLAFHDGVLQSTLR